MKKLLPAVAVYFALAFCFSAPTHPEPAPLRIAECEGISLGEWLCGNVWTFSGTSGKLKAPNDKTADLTIERFDDQQVLIRRTDTGMSAGLTAVYTGKRKGHRIAGEIVYTWPGKWPEPKHGTFSATMDNPGFGAVAAPAFRGPYPDLSGIWHVSTDGRPVNGLAVAIIPSGPEVSMVLLANGQPRSLTYEGHFESRSLISGSSCESAHDRNRPDCLPELAISTVLDPSHVKDDVGNDLEKVAGRDDPLYARAVSFLPAKGTKPLFPDQPFDLTGTWQSLTPTGLALRIQIKNSNGLVDMWGPFGGYPFFTGWYLRNPVIGGTALSKASKQDDVKWNPATLFMESPDSLQMDFEGNYAQMIRISAPAAHQIPCDVQNTYHVDPFHAWVRGHVAMNEKDDDTARCWLSLTANAGYAPGQAMYAAFLIQTHPPDYDQAFQLAVNSAKQGDIGGELLLAQLFREGKGTALDPVKAKYWQDQAQTAQSMKLWRKANSQVYYGLSLKDLVDLSLKMTEFLVNDANEMAMAGYRYNCVKAHTCGP